jgi:hypothetical protein
MRESFAIIIKNNFRSVKQTEKHKLIENENENKGRIRRKRSTFSLSLKFSAILT